VLADGITRERPKIATHGDRELDDSLVQVFDLTPSGAHQAAYASACARSAPLERTPRQLNAILHSAFCILHSEFCILHSEF
jgi:hypothetical protein